MQLNGSMADNVVNGIEIETDICICLNEIIYEKMSMQSQQMQVSQSRSRLRLCMPLQRVHWQYNSFKWKSEHKSQGRIYLCCFLFFLSILHLVVQSSEFHSSNANFYACSEQMFPSIKQCTLRWVMKTQNQIESTKYKEDFCYFFQINCAVQRINRLKRISRSNNRRQ